MLSIPEGTVVIPEGAFQRCSAAYTLSLPSTLQRIEASAFSQDHGLSTAAGVTGDVVIPASVESIGRSAFYGAFVTSITFASVSRLSVLGNDVCHNARQLSTVSMPEVSNLTAVPANAFRFAFGMSVLPVLPEGVLLAC